jgi:formiminoglutamase
MQYFTFYKKENHLAFTKTRAGEIKLGQVIGAVNPKKWQDELKKTSAKFVIIGIPEDIGVKANFGIGGTHTAWPSFLSSFMNLQSNNFLNGDSILLLGYFDFSILLENIKGKPVEYLRDITAEIDKHVSGLVQKIIECDKIPIVIGGGHNNAYGNLKGAALGLQKINKSKDSKINVVNLDAHTDLRALEGRHSGNGFSYAMNEGYLDKYAVLGMHESYVPQSVLDEYSKNKNTLFISLEDIFVRENILFLQALKDALQFTKSSYTGLEIDLDAIENVLTSAMTPAGISVLDARKFVHHAASQNKVAYLHICEGAAKLDNRTSSATTGKLISYLIADFIKAYEGKK